MSTDKCGWRKFLVILIVAQLLVMLVVHTTRIKTDTALHLVAGGNLYGYSKLQTQSVRDIWYNLPTDFLGSVVVDVHREDAALGHTYGDGGGAHDDVTATINHSTVAIGLAITSRKLLASDLRRWPFFQTLLMSFCRTASPGYHYHFFLAYDYVDHFFAKMPNMERFAAKFANMTFRVCPRRSKYALHFVQCSHKGNPAQAQNDAMMAAYMLNIAFYYRCVALRPYTRPAT